MLQPTIFEVLYDILHYYEVGSFSTFDRCCRKTFDYLKIPYSEEFYRKFRLRLFYFFRDFGLIEVANTSDNSYWKISPATLIEIDYDAYILVASPNLGRKVEQKIKRQLTWHKISWTNDYQLEAFHTEARFLKIPRKLVDELLSTGLVDGGVANQVQWKLASCLPSFSELVPKVTEHLDESTNALFSSEINYQFNFKSFSWDIIDSRSITRGLFKKIHNLRRPEYFIQDYSSSGLSSLWRMVSEEWSVIIGAYLLSVKIPVYYNREVSECGFPLNVQLPTYLRRLMLLGSYSPPKIDDNRFWFSRTKPSIIDRICDQLPVFYKRNI